MKSHRLKQGLTAALALAGSLGAVPMPTVAPTPATVEQSRQTERSTPGTPAQQVVQAGALAALLSSGITTVYGGGSGCPWPGRTAARARHNGKGRRP